jgi:hypothetical protein
MGFILQMASPVELTEKYCFEWRRHHTNGQSGAACRDGLYRYIVLGGTL